MNDATISVVVPVYNGESFISHCLDSIVAQSYPAFEIIVINDGSTDHTAEILDRYRSRICVIEQTNRGCSAARNTGILAARGRYVAFLDADDIYYPNHLRQLAHRAKHHAAEIFFDWPSSSCETPKHRLPHYLNNRGGYAYIRRCPIYIINMMIDRQWLLSHDISFHEDISIAEDKLFCWEMMLMGARVQSIRQPGTHIGRHKKNTTANSIATYDACALAYDALEAFAISRDITIDRKLSASITMGRQHATIMRDLLRLHHTAPGTPRQARLRTIFHHLFNPKHTRTIERARCALALLWAVGLGQQNRFLTRCIFGLPGGTNVTALHHDTSDK